MPVGAVATAMRAPLGCHASGGCSFRPSSARGGEDVTPRAAPLAIFAGSSRSPSAPGSRSSRVHTRNVDGSNPGPDANVAKNWPSPRHDAFAVPGPAPHPSAASANTRKSFVMQMSAPAPVTSANVSPSGFHDAARRPPETTPTHSG